MNQNDLKQIDFYECRERWAMNQLYDLHIKPTLSKYFVTELHLTTTHVQNSTNRTCYDAVIYLRDKITLKIAYKFICEIKYRDADYETIMLEKHKHSLLKKTLREANQYKAPYEDVAILYINFTPRGAYVFNLNSEKITDFLKKKVNKIKELHNKTTFISNDIKVNKDIYYLPKTLAKYYPMTIGQDYKLVYELKNSIPVKVEKEIIKTYSIF